MHIHMRRVLAGLTLAAGLATVSAIAQSGAVTVAIDVAQSRRAINPNVYGVAYATPTQLADLNAPLNRYGGNNTTRYNWQINADNRGQDWYFQSIPESQRHGRQARRRLHRRCQERRRAAGNHHSDHRLGGATRRQSREAGELLNRQVRPADRQRLAVVSRCGQRHPRQRRRQDHLERPGRCQHAEQRDGAAGLDQSPRHAMGRGRKRRA